MSILNDHLTLTNSVQIPQLGFGTWQTSDTAAPEAVGTALRLGYRHIDTAYAYGNEDGVGKALQLANLERSEIFVTTKIPAQVKTAVEAKSCLQESLRRLNTEYVDLLLIHAPRPWDEMRPAGQKNYNEENIAVWGVLQEAYQQGLVRAIGVSNFEIADIQNLLAHCDIAPMANQIEFHIGHTSPELVEFCHSQGIVVEAYSPLGTGKLLTHADLVEVAAGYQKSVAQLCIRYALQKGTVALPKSEHAEYIQANTEVDFEISEPDMTRLDALVIER